VNDKRSQLEDSSCYSEFSACSKRSKPAKTPGERKAKKVARLEAFRMRREAKGRKVKTVSFAKEEKLVSVHPVLTYKKWNHRQYMIVCSNLSYFEDQEGQEEEMVEENFDQPMGDIGMTVADIEREQLSRESHVEDEFENRLDMEYDHYLTNAEVPRIRKRPQLGIEGLYDEEPEEEQEFENAAPPVKRSCLGLQEDMPPIPDHSSVSESNGQSPASKEAPSSNLDFASKAEGSSEKSEVYQPMHCIEVDDTNEIEAMMEQVLAESPTPSEQAKNAMQLPEQITIKRFGTPPPPKADLPKLDRDAFKTSKTDQ
jgi:hypothetical protein